MNQIVRDVVTSLYFKIEQIVLVHVLKLLLASSVCFKFQLLGTKRISTTGCMQTTLSVRSLAVRTRCSWHTITTRAPLTTDHIPSRNLITISLPRQQRGLCPNRSTTKVPGVLSLKLYKLFYNTVVFIGVPSIALAIRDFDWVSFESGFER